MADPPETDLDYYSRPENYGGSNLTQLNKFIAAKKETKQKKVKKKKRNPAEVELYRRYRYVLPIDEQDYTEDYLEIDEIVEEEEEEEEEEEGASPEPEVTDKGASPDLKKIPEIEATAPDDKPQIQDAEISGMSQTQAETSSIDLQVHSASKMSMSGASLASGKRTGSVAPSRGHKIKANKELRSRLARERFYKVVRKLMIVKIVERSIAQKSDSGDKQSTLNQLTQVDDTLEENLRNQGLSFDPSYFKAKREINISSEVKHILSLEKEHRTPEQIQTAMFGLQSLRSFAEYPLHMQEKLCKVAIYEVVPPKRVLIRQGHHAENFYFILSGQAVVTILVKDPKTGESVNRVATIMRKGMSFGELALLHHSRRTATVSSQDTVQMLTIGREDFFDIFMAGSGPGQIPDHIKFVSQLDFMKNWPIDRLVENSQHCLLHFFKRNVVIVKDSRVNDWLYVVKSGSCQVMKMLKGVTARTSLSKKDVKMDQTWELPNLPTAEQEAKVDTGRKKKRKEDLTEEQLFRRWNDILGENETAPEVSFDRNDSFSLDIYKKQPTTSKPHFSMCKSAKEERDRKKGERMSGKYRSPRIMKSAQPNLAPTKPGNVFVQVEHLKPRDVFGLPSIQFDDDIAKSETSVSLVSRGAECIMVSKEFYVKHANEQVKKLIRQQVRPYPAEETFQENLQIKTDWEYYKQAMVGEITEELRSASRSSC